MDYNSLSSSGNDGRYPKKYIATLSQSGTNAPVATVLYNSLGGTLVWSRDSAGNYFGTLTGAFPDATKTIILIGNGGSAVFNIVSWNDANSIYVSTANGDTPFAGVDDQLANTSIYVLVYP